MVAARCWQQDGQWLMYSGSYSSHRFSPLTQITTGNVAKLRPAWVYQPPGSGIGSSRRRSSPTGSMYASRRGRRWSRRWIWKSGKPLWEWTQRPIAPSVLNLGFPRVNRGVAVLDNLVYVGTLDGYLFALDARAGVERWSVHVGENMVGHSITAAPLVVEDKVIVGISGGEAGIRGFLDAYDAKTGKPAWRFYTIPSPGEPGSEGWPGDKLGPWRRRDVAHRDRAILMLKLLYWGTGNPGPDWNGDSRKGDNLYTSSLVAIDVETGKPRWHFQFTPHDTHDWDANQIPVLVDTQIAGRPRALVVTANRNGFYTYALDRKTGEFLFGTPCMGEADLGEGARRAWDGRSKSPAWSRPKKARSSIRACRDPPTGQAVVHARSPTCSTCRCARWDRSITRPAWSTSRAPTTRAAARSGWTKNRGAPFARST